jgi:hypothetical protein
VEGLFGWERKMNKRMNVETIIGVVESILVGMNECC